MDLKKGARPVPTKEASKVNAVPTLDAVLPKDRKAEFYEGDGKTMYCCTVKCFHDLQLFQVGDTVTLPAGETLPADYFDKT